MIKKLKRFFVKKELKTKFHLLSVDSFTLKLSKREITVVDDTGRLVDVKMMNKKIAKMSNGISFKTKESLKLLKEIFFSNEDDIIIVYNKTIISSSTNHCGVEFKQAMSSHKLNSEVIEFIKNILTTY